MKKSRFPRDAAICVALIIINLAVIWGNSLLSTEDSAARSGFIVKIIVAVFGAPDADTALIEHLVRKCAHFTEFACLGALSVWLSHILCRYDLKETLSNVFLPLLCCLLSASTDETIQIFTGRGNAVSDVLLDFSGSCTAAIIFLVTAAIIKTKRAKAGAALIEAMVNDASAEITDDAPSDT